MQMNDITKMLAELEQFDDWFTASEEECKRWHKAFRTTHVKYVQGAVDALCAQNRKAPKVGEVQALIPAIRAKLDATTGTTTAPGAPRIKTNRQKRDELANSPNADDVKTYTDWKARRDAANREMAGGIDPVAYEMSLARKGVFKVRHPHPYGEVAYSFEKIGKNIGTKKPETPEDFWLCLGIFGNIIKRLGNEANKHSKFFENYPFLKPICLNIGYGKLMNAAVNELNLGERNEEIFTNFKNQFNLQKFEPKQE